MLRGALVAGLGGRFMFGSVPGVNHPPWYRVGLDGSAPCVWLVCVNSSWRVGRVLNIPVHEDPAMFSSQALRVRRKMIFRQALRVWQTLIFRRTSRVWQTLTFCRTSWVWRTLILCRTSRVWQTRIFRRTSRVWRTLIFRRTAWVWQTLILRRTAWVWQTRIFRRTAWVWQTLILRRKMVSCRTLIFRRSLGGKFEFSWRQRLFRVRRMIVISENRGDYSCPTTAKTQQCLASTGRIAR